MIVKNVSAEERAAEDKVMRLGVRSRWRFAGCVLQGSQSCGPQGCELFRNFLAPLPQVCIPASVQRLSWINSTPAASPTLTASSDPCRKRS